VLILPALVKARAGFFCSKALSYPQNLLQGMCMKTLRTMKSACWAALTAFMLSAVMGCAGPRPIHPDAVVLQDPLPGQALVYLLRAPHDGLDIGVNVNAKQLVMLPPESYTALSLPAGKHVLTTFSSASSPHTPVAPPLEISVSPNQRVFYAIAGVTEKSVGLSGFIPIGGGGLAPLMLPRQAIVAGSRSWKEFSELDARGLLTVSRLVLPEH